MEKITIGTAVSTGPGRTDGMLQVGWLPDGYPMEIPVVIQRAEREGPTVWIHGCVHGNEYCGTFIIHKALRELKLDRGTVIALPVLNITGFQKQQRMSPFEGYNGGDLNRCFPGNPGGSLTEQMAFHVFEALKAHATHFIDFHTAFTADTRWALFCPPDGKAGEQAQGMARAFGYRDTLPTPMTILGGSALIEAAKLGIPGLIVEAGGIGPAFRPETVDEAVGRLNNVLRQIGLVDGAVEKHADITFFSNFAWVNARRGGLFRPAVRCGMTIGEGDVVGRYYDVHGALIEEAKAPFSGVVLAVGAGPLMPNGEILVHVGLDPRAA
ncbi:MAG: succinylglutamate desuccinylase/aspartoacylase family protein [Ferrovibrionaceae bacterium]